MLGRIAGDPTACQAFCRGIEVTPKVSTLKGIRGHFRFSCDRNQAPPVTKKKYTHDEEVSNLRIIGRKSGYARFSRG